jgi:hypothetical protein
VEGVFAGVAEAVKPRDRVAIVLVIAALIVGSIGVYMTTHVLLST